MGLYYSQALTVSGPRDEFVRFLELCFKKNEAGQLVDLKAGPWSQEASEFEERGDSLLLDFEVASLSERALTVRFSTKGVPVGSLVRVMGQEFTGLRFRLAALDDSNEVSFVATSCDGTFAEEYVDATVEFITEVEGQPRSDDSFYTAPSVIQPWPLTHIRFWLAERTLSRLLRDYPVYEPPFVGLPSNLSTEQAEANFERFMSTRGARMEQLRAFLEKFKGALDPADASLRELDRWIARYAAFLAVRETGASFTTYDPAWRDARLGQNVIFDLSTFLGEAVILRNPGFHWELHLDIPSGLRKGSEHYQTFVLRGPNPADRRRIWPLDRVRNTCEALRQRSFMWKKPSFTISPSDAVDNFFSYTLAHATEPII